MSERKNFNCTVDGCSAPAICRQLCRKHSTRFYRHGDPSVNNQKSYAGVKCAHSDCVMQARWNGWCGKHAMRVKRYGDPDYLTPSEERRKRCREANAKTGKVKPTTYKKYLGRHIHRQVAEEKLGRALQYGEIVHHVDGDKHNNDPANLQVLIDQSVHARAHRKNGGRFR